jgi:hypothetical protein
MSHPSPRAPLRVVLLTKNNHLGRYLEARLAATGHLAAVVHEVRLANRQEKLRYAWKFAKKEGIGRTLDVMLYDAYEALMRRGELRRALDTLLPIPERAGAPAYPLHTVRSLNAPETRELLTSLRPDVFVVHATGILSPKTYELAGMLAMNIHCGVLPEYRGHASTFWALWNRDARNVGVSVHEIAKIVDTGRVLRLGRVELRPDDTDVTAWLRAVAAGADLTIDVVRKLAAGEDPGAATLEGGPGPHYPRRGLTDYLGYKLGRRPRVKASTV